MSEHSAQTTDASASAPVNPTSALDLVMSRVFDAPRQLVWDAWTKPEHLQIWQGAPEGMTVTVEESDIRTGGRYKICMHGPDGADHWLNGVYREVAPPEQIVCTHSWIEDNGQSSPETILTLRFAELGNKTELSLHQTGFQSPQSRDGHEGGFSSTLDRIAAYLRTVRK